MTHEVKIGNATFFVNSFSRKGATDTAEQLLRRVIVRNAERVFTEASRHNNNEVVYPPNTS